METALAILLISTLTTNGLLALWAATSRRHWFLRTAIYLACLAPLLLVPAYEPFVGLACQGAFIAFGIHVGRWIVRLRKTENLREQGERRPWNFSLSTLLFAAVIVAAASAVSTEAPPLNRQAWINVVGIGTFAGVASLASYAAIHVFRRRLRVLLVILLLLVATFAGLIMGGIDQFLLSFVDVEAGWPPTPPDPTAIAAPIDPAELPFLAWLATSLGICLGTLGVVGLLDFLDAGSRRHQRSHRFVRGITWLTLTMVVVVLAAPAALVFSQLATPEPIPTVEMPEPNGYVKLSDAWRSIENAAIVVGSVDAYSASETQLIPAVEEVSAAVNLARESFADQIVCPLDYSPIGLNSSPFADIFLWRGLSRAFSATGRLQLLQGQVDAALSTYVDLIRLGVVGRRGGLVVDGMVGAAVTGAGASGIWELIERLDSAQCRRALGEIEQLIADTEPFEEIEHRDFVWDQYAYGWHGRLFNLLAYGTGESEAGQYQWVFLRESAILRLLMANLSLRGFRAENGRLPQNWEEMVAAGWPPLQSDPFDPEGKPLRYVRSANGADFVLYSVNNNQVDDGGAAPEKDQWGIEDFTSGDLRLDIHFAPDSSAPSASSNAAEPEDAQEIEGSEVEVSE